MRAFTARPVASVTATTTGVPTGVPGGTDTWVVPPDGLGTADAPGGVAGVKV